MRNLPTEILHTWSVAELQRLHKSGLIQWLPKESDVHPMMATMSDSRVLVFDQTPWHTRAEWTIAPPHAAWLPGDGLWLFCWLPPIQAYYEPGEFVGFAVNSGYTVITG
jgi:hypothetical protein